MTKLRKCTKCLASKPLDSFSKNKLGSQGKMSWCKSCQKDYMRERRKTDKGKQEVCNNNLKKSYGISLEDYNNMVKAQGNCCKLCSVHTDSLGKQSKLYVDHCHSTGKVRGLLCNNCNSALGKFKDDADLMYKAISYVLTEGDMNYIGNVK